MDLTSQVKAELAKYTNPERAKHSIRYFQAQPGGYGEGDQFLGISVPDQQKVARKYYRKISLAEAEELLQSPIHEHRLTALTILNDKFEKATPVEQEEIVQLYLRNIPYVNNWDLVDTSAYKILGAYLYPRQDRSLLYELARSENMWAQRIAIIATFYFIRQNHFHDALQISTMLLDHPHDLIHKAVGWMLREIGKRDFQTEFDFLKTHYKRMPRVMLNYAIERFDPELKGQFRKQLI